ncbi:protein SOSEKI 5 [Lolium perenne]|uniref:protein SOSEKI 5 n=1 Tax=Lolium perenne TaxID=4522 RepID=UPI0021F5641D|nr:protein SOSEKI 5-like [Lolium perenne]
MASSRGRWASPERTVVWTEPPPKPSSTARRAGAAALLPTKVAVVYYLARNGQLDHPHFMEVALSSPHDGLCLRDVLDRLTVLRGAGMADAYSWSSKRSYKNGYVWHDLTPDDPVHPANGNEYVIKGSELLRLLPVLAPPRPRDGSASSSSSTSSCDPSKTRPPAASGRAARRKNWSSFDLGEYRVAAVSRGADALAADAATQTDERRGPRRGRTAAAAEQEAAARTELGIDEISPPPSSSSPDTLETLIQHDARLALASAAPTQPAAGAEVGVISGGRMRASTVLMQLISCGSIPAPAKRDGGPARRLPRGRSDLSSSTGTGTAADGFSGSMSGVGVSMEREYFSGSLVETKKTTARDDRAGVGGELGALRRSSSYNADRARDTMNTSSCNKFELAEEEVDGVRARCIPAGRKPGSTNRLPASGRRSSQPEPAALTEEN